VTVGAAGAARIGIPSTEVESWKPESLDVKARAGVVDAIRHPLLGRARFMWSAGSWGAWCQSGSEERPGAPPACGPQKS